MHGYRVLNFRCPGQKNHYTPRCVLWAKNFAHVLVYEIHRKVILVLPMYTKANDVWLSLNGEHVHTFKVEYSLLSQLQSMFLFANTTTTNVTGRTKDYVTKHSLLNRPMRCLHFDKVYWVTGTETRLCRDSETTTKIVNFVVTYWIYYNKVGHAK